jgi:hypothetical protein
MVYRDLIPLLVVATLLLLNTVPRNLISLDHESSPEQSQPARVGSYGFPFTVTEEGESGTREHFPFQPRNAVANMAFVFVAFRAARFLCSDFAEEDGTIRPEVPGR